METPAALKASEDDDLNERGEDFVNPMGKDNADMSNEGGQPDLKAIVPELNETKKEKKKGPVVQSNIMYEDPYAGR